MTTPSQAALIGLRDGGDGDDDDDRSGSANGNGNGNGNGNRYRRALDRLAPLRPVLAGLNHRNRNQHRGARWWGAFGMLRRHVGKLADELDVAAARMARLSSSSSSSSSSSRTDERGKRKRRDDEPDRNGVVVGPAAAAALAGADGRAAWLRDALVPRCYLYVYASELSSSSFRTPLLPRPPPPSPGPRPPQKKKKTSTTRTTLPPLSFPRYLSVPAYPEAKCVCVCVCELAWLCCAVLCCAVLVG